MDDPVHVEVQVIESAKQATQQQNAIHDGILITGFVMFERECVAPGEGINEVLTRPKRCFVLSSRRTKRVLLFAVGLANPGFYTGAL